MRIGKGTVIMDERIETFITSLSYYEQINLLISYYMSNDADLTRVEAYERAIIHYTDENLLAYSLSSIVSFGPVSR